MLALPIRGEVIHNPRMNSTTKSTPTWNRLASIDAYRGLVMFLMMAEVLHLAGVWQHFRDSNVWHFLAHNQTHVEWAALSARDLIPGTVEHDRHVATGSWIDWSLHD